MNRTCLFVSQFAAGFRSSRGIRFESSLEAVPIGKILPKKHISRPYNVGTHFIHSEIGYRGVVLYPWEGVVKSESDSAPSNFYQCLVDNRDAEMLPMDLETLRVPEERQSKKDIKPIRFKNWDLVQHNEILHYQPASSPDNPIFQHHLLHHFLEEKMIKKKNKKIRSIRGTPTLSFWRRKFSSKIVKLYETSETVDDDIALKIYHVPYPLYIKAETEVIAHLARFHLDSLSTQFEIIERQTLVENENGNIEETIQPMSIQLGGNFNHIYQHSRHIEIPRNSKSLKFIYSVREFDSSNVKKLKIPICPINSIRKK